MPRASDFQHGQNEKSIGMQTAVDASLRRTDFAEASSESRELDVCIGWPRKFGFDLPPPLSHPASEENHRDFPLNFSLLDLTRIAAESRRRTDQRPIDETVFPNRATGHRIFTTPTQPLHKYGHEQARARFLTAVWILTRCFTRWGTNSYAADAQCLSTEPNFHIIPRERARIIEN